MNNDDGYKKFKAVGMKLQRGVNPNGKLISEMNYEELKQAENKFLNWYPTTNHPDKDIKKHVYENYIKPRIEEIELERNAVDELVLN